VLTCEHGDGLRLLDSYRALHPQRAATEGTFHGFKGTTSGPRIDWILHTPHFRAISAEIVRGSGKQFPSDHFPITAVLEMSDGTSAPD
jgi:endonuclease/exonuclease/phosphatase family metal-dependent hydrolase